MATLLLRLQAPMQSWGISSHFGVRDTCREPTKSGVIGLICAALGRPKNASLADLVQLGMGVRVDREGKVVKDYHIAQDVYRASGGRPKESEPSNRYYLSDAIFLVGLEGQKNLLLQIQAALQKPKWLLYLGRKSFPLSSPLLLPNSLQDMSLLEALTAYPLLSSSAENPLRIVLEDENGTIPRNDVPVSFLDRSFVSRNVRIAYIQHTGEILKEPQDVSDKNHA